MTHIKDAKPEKLTAEREAALREWASGVNRPDTPTTRWWQRDVAQLLATLDAARAETEAVRRERDASEQGRLAASEAAHLLRDLAAELVEGLALAKLRFEALAAHDNTMRNGVRPSVGALEAEALIARARALGIGGEREKNDGRTPRPRGEAAMTREELERQVTSAILKNTRAEMGRVMGASVAARAVIRLCVEACCAVAREEERQQDIYYGVANSGGAAAVEDALSHAFLSMTEPTDG